MGSEAFEEAVVFVENIARATWFTQNVEAEGAPAGYAIAAIRTPSVRRSDGSFFIEDRDAIRLVRAAMSDAGSFDYALSLCVWNVERGRPLPMALRKFTAALLIGHWKRPPVDRRARDWVRNVFLLWMVEEVIARFGLQRSRNDMTAVSLSALDAVEAGTARAGRRVQVDVIKRLTTAKESKLHQEVGEILAAIREVGPDEIGRRYPGNPPDYVAPDYSHLMGVRSSDEETPAP